MSPSTLPPPPPRPPWSLPPPPPPATYPRPGKTKWKDESRPPSVPYPEESRWGLGDAAIATLIYFLTSVGLALLVVVIIDADPLDGPWFPITLIVPQLLQLAFVVWTARHRGSGLGRDFGFAFQRKDVAIGAMLFVVGIVAAGVVAATMDAAGVEPPTSAVAELTEDAVDGRPDDADGGREPGDDDNGATDPDNGSGITIWIVVVAILAATAVPVIEELGYRGLLYGALVKRGHAEWWAVVMSSFIFAIVHLEPTRTPIIFVLGLVLGWGRKLTNRIGASIIAHAIINALAFVALLTTLS